MLPSPLNQCEVPHLLIFWPLYRADDSTTSLGSLLLPSLSLPASLSSCKLGIEVVPANWSWAGDALGSIYFEDHCVIAHRSHNKWQNVLYDKGNLWPVKQPIFGSDIETCQCSSFRGSCCTGQGLLTYMQNKNNVCEVRKCEGEIVFSSIFAHWSLNCII